MRIIKKIEHEETKVTCTKCESTYAYCFYDIDDLSYNTMFCDIIKHGVSCPVCNEVHVLDEHICG